MMRLSGGFQRVVVARASFNSAVYSTMPTLRAVVFDMDGTLTKPNLDFGDMYRRCGVDPKDDILEAITQMSQSSREKAEAVIEEIEEEGRQTLQLMPGAKELMHWCQAHNLPTAIVTRNTRRTAAVLEKLLTAGRQDNQNPFARAVIARDDPPDVPPKPDPAALFKICADIGLDCDRSVLMVGDSPSNDVAFGKSAGVSTALLDTGRRSTLENQKSDDHGDVADGGRTTPDIVVDDLSDLAQELWKNFEIQGHLGSSLLKYDTPTPTTEAATAAAAGDLEALAAFTIDQLNEQDETQNTPLIWASDAGQENVVRFLLEKKKRQKKTMIGLDVRGYLGATAVCRAARRGHTEILKLLAAGGADLDIPNTKLQFPLHFAAFKEHPEAVEALLEHGANPRVLDRKGRVPARDTKNVSIRDRLLKAMQ